MASNNNSTNTSWCLRKINNNNAGVTSLRTNIVRDDDSWKICLEKKSPLSGKDLKNNEVLIDISCSSFNHRDNWMTKGMYPNLTEGICLGSDGCGKVLASTSDETLLNKRVIINPSFGWGGDVVSPKGVLEILGMPRNGTFTTNGIIIPKENVHLAPEHLSDVEAAALPLAGVTAYRALVTKGKAQNKSRVLITGIGGGVALFALQFAVALGCEVYVTSSSQEKIDLAVKKYGAKAGVLYTSENWVKDLLKLSKNQRMEVVIDGAGGDGFNSILRCVQGGARIVLYGTTASPSLTITAPLAFLNQVEILGTAMGSNQEFNEMLQLVNAHKIKPIVDSVYSFEELPVALQKMQQGKQFGKIVLNHHHQTKNNSKL